LDDDPLQPTTTPNEIPFYRTILGGDAEPLKDHYLTDFIAFDALENYRCQGSIR
jgi:hypothetical protein